MLSRLAFRHRIALIVGVAALALAASVAVTLVSGRSAEQQLTGIETQYVPVIEVDRDLKQLWTKTVRALEDSASAADEGKLAEADAAEADFLARLATGAEIVRGNGGDPAALDAEMRRYYAGARAISAAIVGGQNPAELATQVEQMRMQRRGFATLLDHATAPDRKGMANAFASARATQRTSLWIVIVVAAFAFLAMALLSWGLIRRTVSALAAVSAGVEKLASGELTDEIPVTSNDELGALAREANRTAQRLREYRERIETANRELEAFSYSVSHDLRAPLRSIDRFSQALFEDHAAELSEPGQDYLKRVRAAAQRMSELIDDLLRLSRLTRAEMRTEDIELGELAESIVADLRKLHPERSVDVRVHPELHATADRELVRIALENLIHNAWKFTAKVDRPAIEIGAEADAFFVKDNGAGFDMAHAERLFGAFQRLHAEQDFPGTGIGLTTVQRIVSRHGGKIWAEAAVGQGATFRFTLAPRRT